jgi:hypothetical protein
VGKAVSPTPFETIAFRFANAKPKGEFETTAEYKKRLAELQAGSRDPLIIQKPPTDRKYLVYDADKHSLAVKTSAFDWGGILLSRAIDNTEFKNQLRVGVLDNVMAVVSQSQRPVGTYQGSNAYGATRRVQREVWTTQVIYDRTVGNEEGLFPGGDSEPYIAGRVPLSPADAERLKPIITLGFVVLPKPPYLIQGSYQPPFGRPRYDNPREIIDNFTILIADIRCGLVLGPSNLVLAAFQTR